MSWNDGRTEGWAFTDIDHSLSTGLSLKGKAWGRPDDTVAAAAAANGLAKPAQDYFAEGGLGILAGDGRLSYAPEAILETYYSLSVAEPLTLSFDYQLVVDPAFDSARGPVSVFAARLDLEF